MSNQEAFGLGFMTCFLMVGVIGMVIVTLSKSVELLRERARLKRELDKEAERA